MKRWVGFGAALLISSAACGTKPVPVEPGPISTVTPSPTVTPAPIGPAVLAGAGDIAECGSPGASLTSALLDSIPGIVFLAGDNAYDSGGVNEYANCYDPTWGRHKSRTRPTPGNHEYLTPDAAGYFSYFGDLAGPPGLGYYSYTLGSWHVVALNSNIDAGPSSAQVMWLKEDLKTNAAACTLAYWHHPVFSTGEHGNDPKMQDVWRILYAAHADVVLNGHDHDYERFAPLTPDGALDFSTGIREFVVGTGGHSSLRGFPTTNPNTDVRNQGTWGVLKLTLNADRYDWVFLPAIAGGFSDSGSASCVK